MNMNIKTLVLVFLVAATIISTGIATMAAEDTTALQDEVIFENDIEMHHFSMDEIDSQLSDKVTDYNDISHVKEDVILISNSNSNNIYVIDGIRVSSLNCAPALRSSNRTAIPPEVIEIEDNPIPLSEIPQPINIPAPNTGVMSFDSHLVVGLALLISSIILYIRWRGKDRAELGAE